MIDWVQELSPFSGEALHQAGGGGVQGDHQRADGIGHLGVHGHDFEQLRFVLGREVIAGQSGKQGVNHELVHEGAVGLHDVVGEGEGIVAVVVVDAKGAEQPGPG
jgi:hypothetical protein